VAVAAVALAGLEAIPGMFGHDQAALSVELLASNAAPAISKVDPLGRGDSTQPCADLVTTFGVGNHLFKNRRFGFYASIWPSYQALNALYVTALLPSRSACRRDFEQALSAIDTNYWDDAGPPVGGAFDQGPSAFHFTSDLPRVDDSLWMGLAIMQQYSMTRDPALLVRAEAVFTLAVRNWAKDGGGVYWEATGADDHARTVVSNAPAAILGVELFRQTSDARYLDWSEKIVAWLRENLKDPATGLYNDSIDNRGGQNRVGTAKYTYAEGMMVDAVTALSAVDPTKFPLGDAVSLSESSMAYFDAHHSYGQPGFDVIWAESVMRLAGLYGHATFTAEARDAVERAAAAGPGSRGDLLTSASEMALRELAELDPSKLAELLYVLPPTGPHGQAPGQAVPHG
jgi:Glycosyl hydrolase family 76